MPSFSKSTNETGRQKIKIKIQTISGDDYVAEVFLAENLKDLIQDFFEFINVKEDINQTRVSLYDSETPARNKLLSLDESVKDSGIKEGDKVIIMSNEDLISEEDGPIALLVSKKNLQLLIPFRENLPVGQYLKRSNDLLFALDFIYSIFLISHSGNQDSRMELDKIIAQEEKPLQLIDLYRIINKSNADTLRIAKVQYGSPFLVNFEGVWEPLKLLIDVIKDIKWRSKHEQEMAELEKQKMQLEIADKYLDIILKAHKLPMSPTNQKKLLSSLTPNISRIGSVLTASAADMRHKQLQVPSQNIKKPSSA